jgi:Flp pilus assembly protein TadD
MRPAVAIASGVREPIERPSPRMRRIALGLAAALVAATLGGCAAASRDVTGSISTAPPRDAASLQTRIDELGKRYEANRDDARLAIAYATALRSAERYPQAVAVLQHAVSRKPGDLDVIGAYGKALADAGRFKEAAAVLERAHTPDRPNWTILSAQGSVADQLGDHDRAQAYYDAALKIRPGEPMVLSNLGLSYALGRNLPRAEAILRQAAADPRADARVRQNLALVLALSGKFAEAEEVSRRDLSPTDAQANVAAIRRTIAESDAWRKIQQGAARGKRSS